MDENYLKKLVIERLMTMPPNSNFSFIGHGDYSREQLIHEVLHGTEIGKETIKSELNFLREMPKLMSRLQFE